MQQEQQNKCNSSGSDKQTKTAVNKNEQKLIASISLW